MKSKSTWNWQAAFLPASALFAVTALFIGLPAAVHADDSGQPTRAVRLSYVDGNVQLAQNGQVISEQAVANTPLLQGMTLTTADDGRAEIQFEDGSVARISPNSSLTLATLTGDGSSGSAEMDLDSGLAYFELQGNGQAGAIGVRFADNVVTASGFTVLRITDDTPPGELAVFSGNAHIDRSSGPSLDLHGGESAAFNTSDPSGYTLAETIEPNSWDTWNSDRDQALSAEASDQTNAPADLAPGQTSNPAWSDLDASGTWYNVPDQGYVWSPYDAANAGFDPYGNGNWVWTPGFGYTWASAYQWGYLPYQCGAWNYYDGFGWGWAPGFGGCTPWWGAGYYGGPVIGFAPGWYRRVHRPDRPHGPVRGRPIPLIAVNRPPSDHGVGLLPPRGRHAPVTIAGHTVQGLRPTPSRDGYERAVFSSRPAMSSPWTGQAPTQPTPDRSAYLPSRSGYVPQPEHRGGYAAPQPGRTFTQPGQTFTQPNRTFAQPNRTFAQPNRSSAPSRPAPQPTHTYTPPRAAPHPGGGWHPSGGGGNSGGGFHGGGGGGGFHGGGGGGGGGGGSHGGGGGGHR